MTGTQTAATAHEPAALLVIEGITKRFGSVVALDDVTFDVGRDEVVGLVGDNGAGKSTLIKILSGNIQPDEGTIRLESKPLSLHSPADARALGIETVYQDLALCENLDTVANLFIGREIYRRSLGLRFLARKEMERRAIELLSSLGTNMPSVREQTRFLSGGQRQAVALARFVAWGDRLVLLDEPTAALGVRETRNALDLVAKTRREKGVSMIFISHNIEHVLLICDRIVVMRHGRVVGVRERRSTSEHEVVGLITGAISRSGDQAML